VQGSGLGKVIIIPRPPEGYISSKFEIRNSKFKLGFTLAEIIIVLGIVGIIISGILPLFLNIISAGKSAAYYSGAYKIADSKVEEYRNSNFDALADEATPITELPNGTLSTTITNEIDGLAETEIKRVELVVGWNYKRDQEIKIVTYIYRGGL
jgi:prepilin-type N-terminal cleavage/methylation domain-containing protein